MLPQQNSRLDRENALARVGGDEELLREIAALFLADYPRVLADLRAAVARSDAKAIENTAHGLKGSVSTFGASVAIEAALRIEKIGRAQQFAELGPALATLETALAELRPELESL